ncbi:MAG TPA: polysaccharide deacetylase family protein [Allosphingosinicella sp.]|jgi:peptidoglycan/xylan/chitin deacetylase (PgdA/CDA1 family)
MPLKETLLGAAHLLGMSPLARAATAKQLRILCYHGLWVTPGHEYGECTFISPEQFEQRMARLKRSGLPVLPLGEAIDRLAEGTLPKAAVAITIDDGWVSTFTHMLPVLERYELPATLYATTWYSGRDLPVVNVAVDYLVAASERLDVDGGAVTRGIEALPVGQRLEALRRFGRDMGVDEAWLELRQFHMMSPAELADAHRRGLDIQLHTHRHIDVESKVATLPREIQENRAFLEAAIGHVPLTHFCYPSGTFHPDAPSLLAAQGVRSATLVDLGLNAPGADPLRLRRLLDGRNVTDTLFDAYLSGLLHFVTPLGSLVRRRRAAASRTAASHPPQGALIPAE